MAARSVGVAVYPWKQWFTAGTFTLTKGTDYAVAADTMIQMVRNAASKHDLSAHVVRDGTELTVTVSPRSATLYLGVDPGAGGGLAALKPDGTVRAVAGNPGDHRELLDWLTGLTAATLLDEPVRVTALLERVGGYAPGTGNGTQPGSHMFNFGAGYGALQMALTAAGIAYEQVQPAVWQRGLGIPPRVKPKEGQPEFKRRLKSVASGMFPDVKVTMGTADALLIAEFARRKGEGLL